MSPGYFATAGQAIAGQTEVADAKLFRTVHQDSEDDRVQMQVQVAVDMVERQAAGMEFIELCMNFSAKLFLQVMVEEIFHSDADGAVGKFAV